MNRTGAVGPGRLSLQMPTTALMPVSDDATDALWAPLLIATPLHANSLWQIALLALLALALTALLRARRRAADAAQERDRKAHLSALERFADIALEDAEVGRWVWDLKRGAIEFSNGWLRMMRLREDDHTGELNDWFQRIHPNYASEVKEAIAAHLEGKNPRFECDYRIQRGDGSYLWVLSRAVVHRDKHGRPEYLVGAQIDITAVVDVEKRVLHDAYIDKLTGLPNRRAFTSILERACVDSKDDEFRFALVFIDLNRFKQVNDSLGHAVGDELLAAVAARLNRQRRSGDTVARLGGDEFVALLGDIEDAEQAFEAARRIHRVLADPFQLGRHEVYSGGSVGIAISGGQDTDPETIMRQADQAMYQAKSGRQGVVLFSDNMRGKASRALSLQTELSHAAERQEMQLYFQPIVELSSGRIVAAEALLRWMRPDGERVQAAEFIPIAEELGILGELGDLALRMACTQRAAWVAQGFAEFLVAVNIGSLQLQKQDFAAHVESVLSQTNLSPHLLEIEITESSLIDSLHVASMNLGRLGELGVGLSLDDFGLGYASLAFLQKYPFRSVKVDRTLLADLEPGSRDTRHVRGIVAMLHEMELCAVAEGVEDPNSLQFLQGLGFDLAQGYSLGRPMAADELTHLLAAEAKLHRRPAPTRQFAAPSV